MAVLDLTLPVERPWPALVPRRDLALAEGEALTLRFTLVRADRPGAARYDLSGLGVAVMAKVWGSAWMWDYGSARRVPALWGSAQAVVVDAPAGRADVTFDAAETGGWPARLLWTVALDVSGVPTVLCMGAIAVAGGPAVDGLPGAVLDDAYLPITDDGGIGIVA